MKRSEIPPDDQLVFHPDFPDHLRGPAHQAIADFIDNWYVETHPEIELWGVSLIDAPDPDWESDDGMGPMFITAGSNSPNSRDNWGDLAVYERLFPIEEVLLLRPLPPSSHRNWSNP